MNVGPLSPFMSPLTQSTESKTEIFTLSSRVRIKKNIHLIIHSPFAFKTQSRLSLKQKNPSFFSSFFYIFSYRYILPAFSLCYTLDPLPGFALCVRAVQVWVKCCSSEPFSIFALCSFLASRWCDDEWMDFFFIIYLFDIFLKGCGPTPGPFSRGLRSRRKFSEKNWSANVLTIFLELVEISFRNCVVYYKRDKQLTVMFIHSWMRLFLIQEFEKNK